MNKEDSAVKVIQGWTDPDIDMHPGRLSMSLLLRANANPGDVPCGVVIGSNAIPEGEVVRLRDQIQQARELLKRAKTGTRFARQYQAMVDKDKPATTGIEFDNDVDAFLLSTL